jgi:FtsP/CotA-like multicopper oxidase with cupredoxin domain
MLDLSFEQTLRSIAPLTTRKADREATYHLHGTMTPYVWNMQRLEDMANPPLTIKEGERVRIKLFNQSEMTHPIHLHGHHFQVVDINGTALTGAMRDTVIVPPNKNVTIEFDANNPGKWAFHCHHLYHMMTGMMNFIQYEGIS